MTQLIHNLLPMPPRKIIYIHPSDNMQKCVKLMTEFDIGALVVVDDNRKLVGLVTERDIVNALYKGCDLETTRADEIAYIPVTILSPHDAVEKAMQTITRTKRRHILICDKNNYLAIVSIGDVLYYLLADKAHVIEQLENYIHTY